MFGFDSELDRILYNLESEYLESYQRVTKGKDSAREMAANNIDTSERGTAALLAWRDAAVVKELEAVWNIKTEGLFDNGEVFMKQEPIKGYLLHRIAQLKQRNEEKNNG